MSDFFMSNMNALKKELYISYMIYYVKYDEMRS